MVGEGSPHGPQCGYSLEEILTEKQVARIVRKYLNTEEEFQVVSSKAGPAADGLPGFLADHVRLLLQVECAGQLHELKLFVKRVPVANKPKAEFINGNNYFKRERLIFQLLEEMKGGEGPRAWCARAYVSTDSLVVMPDLAAEGYELRPLLPPLDLAHARRAVAAVARFHAAFANYETNKTIDPKQPFDFYREYGHLLTETTFQDTPWVRTGAKLSADFINAFSTKYKNLPGLEEALAKQYVRACASLDIAEGTLNVVVHKDLWINNILFKYELGQPSNALLIDYQCVRYGPPAFDLTSFLYLNTTRKFREEYESQILKHYFEVFSASLENATRKRLDAIGYDEEEFLLWCEKSRMYGVFEALAIYPQVLMDAKSAEQAFDDPETYMKMIEEDRSEPVLAYAKKQPLYRQRILEVCEEFVERYVLRT